MHIIKLNAIDSTNSYLRRMAAKGQLNDFTIVSADVQTEGRGQMGTVWVAEEGKNLSISIFKKFSSLDSKDNFKISMLVSIGLTNALNYYNLRHLRVKWPNDILSDNKKIGGILIENIVKNKSTIGTIIGIGLNLNQQKFKNLPKASSLKNLTGINYNRDEVMLLILEKIKDVFISFENTSIPKIKILFEKQLFRMNKPSTFENEQGEYFTGYIKGVSDYGKLRVLVEDELIEEFDLKEIKMLY